MKRGRLIWLAYCQLLVLFLLVAVLLAGQLAAIVVPFLLLAPVLFYLSGDLIGRMLGAGKAKYAPSHLFFGRLLRLYSTITTIFLLASSVFLIKSVRELLFSLLILPLPAYFLSETFFSRPTRRTLRPEKPVRSKKEESPAALEGELVPVEPRGVSDLDRRQFLKLLGGGGISMVVLLMLNPQKASAAFFGSGPGPGAVTLKNSSGSVIDPKEKSPTDGYTIAEIDDSGTDSYYGFTNKDGAWYISKEGSDGSYRYFKGSGNFAASWGNKEGLGYNYFDNIF